MAIASPLTVESAQQALGESEAALVALQDRLAIGDTSVSGRDLLEAEAQARADRELLSAAQRAAQAIVEAETEEARRHAVERLGHEYQASSSELASALQAALDSMQALVTVAGDHAARTLANAQAAGITSLARPVPGVGHLGAPKTDEVLTAVHILTAQAAGVHTGFSYPGTMLDPCRPFLPA